MKIKGIELEKYFHIVLSGNMRRRRQQRRRLRRQSLEGEERDGSREATFTLERNKRQS
jgi:hypothetical protein